MASCLFSWVPVGARNFSQLLFGRTCSGSAPPQVGFSFGGGVELIGAGRVRLARLQKDHITVVNIGKIIGKLWGSTLGPPRSGAGEGVGMLRGTGESLI